MTRRFLYAGSFDPVTNGHLDIIKAALAITDELVVAIGVHPAKAPLFSFEERAELIRQSVVDDLGESDAQRLQVHAFDGLVVDAVRDTNASAIVRGLRESMDFAYEMSLAGMNAGLDNGVQTVFLPATPASRHISATLVRQIASMKGDVAGFVPPCVAHALVARYAR